MLKSKRERRRFFTIFLAGMIISFAIFFLNVWRENRQLGNGTIWGVTFAKAYAEYLGVDWRSAYLSALDDLKVRHLRIPVYWNEIEKSPKNYNFDDFDWMLKEAEARGAKVLLGVGRKLPRWPECHIPDWAKKIPQEEQDLKLLGTLQATVKHFKNSQALMAWQVENEALFPFGLCPKHTSELLRKEAEIVRGLDSRPIVITDSGELSNWVVAADIADILGVSMYRVAWNQFFGYIFYPIPPAYYRKKAEAVARYVDQVIVTELQAEPWGPLPLKEMPLSQQYQSMNIKRFKENIDFGRRTGLSPIYLWGVEWWYALKEKHGNAEFWEEAKRLWR